MIEHALRFRDISRSQAFVQAGKERGSGLGQSLRDCLVQLFQPTLDPDSQLRIDFLAIRYGSVTALQTIPIHCNHSSMLVDDL